MQDDTHHHAHVSIGFETAGHTDADHFTLKVIQGILGSWNAASVVGAHSSSILARVRGRRPQCSAG